MRGARIPRLFTKRELTRSGLGGRGREEISPGEREGTDLDPRAVHYRRAADYALFGTAPKKPFAVV